MLRLGVNIDHVATLREARYPAKEVVGETGLRPEPDPIALALVCLKAGAHSITAHLREDRRHIQDHDIWALKGLPQVELNLEMAVTEAMVDFAVQLNPEEACFVPEKRQEVTTEGGLDVVKHFKKVKEGAGVLRETGTKVSLFIDAEPEQVHAAVESGAECIELHTGPFANAKENREAEVKKLIEAAVLGNRLGLSVHAGHGLNYENLNFLWEVPHLSVLNIGHSIISRSLTVGLENAVKEMLKLMEGYHG